MKDVSAAGGAWPSKCYMIHGEKLRYYGKFSRRFTKLFNDAYQDYGSFKEKQFDYIRQQTELQIETANGISQCK